MDTQTHTHFILTIIEVEVPGSPEGQSSVFGWGTKILQVKKHGQKTKQKPVTEACGIISLFYR